MPLLIAVIILLTLFALFLFLIPVTLWQRYRAGTRRRKARRWVATVNLASLVLSTILFLVSTSILSIAAPGTLTMSAMGLAVGAGLGLLGVALTRWEPTPEAIHYKPNEILIFTIVVVVAARILYGMWRAWSLWPSGGEEPDAFLSSVGTSVAFGGIVLGYYLVFWASLRSRLSTHRLGPRRRR